MWVSLKYLKGCFEVTHKDYSYISMVYFNSFLGYLLIILGCILGALRVERIMLQWVCLEINMLCIIPILLGGRTQDSIICGVKYFISQSAASVRFLFSLLLIDLTNYLYYVTLASIIFKLGVPPFHRWIVGIIFNINLIELFLVLTVQKFIPLLIISQLGIRENLLLGLILISASFIIINLNRNLSLQYILFLSSVGNGMWMLAALIGRVWGLFLIMYSLILVRAVTRMITSKIVKLRDLAIRDNTKKFEVALQFFNLGGVPPLIGFAVKLIVLKNLISLRLTTLIILVLISVIILYIYLVMMYQVYTVSPTPVIFQSNISNNKFLSLNVRILLLFRAARWVIL